MKATWLRRRPRWQKRAMLLAGSVGLMLLAAELFLRVVGAGVPPGLIYDFDPLLGMRLSTNFAGWQRREGEVWVTTNRFHQRDHDRPLAKPAGTFRIAILGDSYAEAQQVEIDEAFWSVAERELAGCETLAGQEVDCVNFGVSGYGTAQQYLQLCERVWSFEPDLVVLAFLPYNDIRNNSKRLEPETYRPFFELVDGKLVLDRSGLEGDASVARFQGSRWIRLKHFCIAHSRLCGLVYQVRQALRAGGQVAAGEPVVGEVGLDAQVYSLEDPEWQEAWEVTAALLTAMKRETDAHRVPLVVMSVTSGVQVDPDVLAAERLARQLGVEDLLRPERELAELGRREAIPILLLTEAMQRHAVETGEYLHGFPNAELGRGHWNVAGHRQAGKLLAEFLCSQLQRGLLESVDPRGPPSEPASPSP